jgi:hypothetical protein
MQWPKEILDLFAHALEIEPAAGLDRADVLRALLDGTARRAVWRARGNPADARAALRTPYTPLGSLIGSGVEGRAARLSLAGERWGQAVDALHAYIEENAEAVFSAFRDEAQPYDDLIG